MSTPLNDRVLFDPKDGSRRTFAEAVVKREYIKVAESWEAGYSRLLQIVPSVDELPSVLSIIADFVSGQTGEDGALIRGSAQKTWRIDCAQGCTSFSLGVDNGFILVRDTGDYQALAEGGYDSIYSVILADVPEEKSIFVYDMRSFPTPPGYTRERSPGEAAPFVPKGPVEDNINTMRTVYDEELDELRGRGVRVVIIPADLDSSLTD